jgi:hypothetical protein
MFDAEALKYLVPALVAVVGWLVAHRFSAYRDRQNKRRDLRVEFLIEAYRRLESVTNRPKKTEEQALAFESAIADIQLLGTPDQVNALLKYIQEFTAGSGGGGDITEVLKLLRADLRNELSLRGAVQDALVFRFIRPEP